MSLTFSKKFSPHFSGYPVKSITKTGSNSLFVETNLVGFRDSPKFKNLSSKHGKL